MTTPLPLEPRHSALGASFEAREGWSVPEHYGDPAAEADAVLGSSGGVCDLSSAGRLAVEGPDAAAYLHRVMTQDILGLREGSAAWTCATNHKGKLVAAGPILRRAENRFLWLLDPGAFETARDWLDRFALGDAVELREGASAGGIVCVLGAPAETSLPGIAAARIWEGETWLVAFDAESLAELWEEQRELHRPVGALARERWRVERGRPASPGEINGDATPWDVGLHRAVSLEKGCYTGQESLNRLRTYDGVRHELARLVGEGEPDGVVVGASLADRSGSPVGRVTTVVSGSREIRALGMVHRDAVEAGGVVLSGTAELRVEPLRD